MKTAARPLALAAFAVVLTPLWPQRSKALQPGITARSITPPTREAKAKFVAVDLG